MTIDTAEWAGATLCDGRYRVLRKLGEGGMAHVYLAHDDKLERDVVIKVGRSNLVHDSGFTGRFTREVRSLAKLSHPHIVPLIDIGQHDSAPFAVMQYLTGGSLRDRQPRGEDGHAAPAPYASLLSWLPAIAQALDFVHKNHFIHRDVKPENILFDADDQVFLADLGIIKALAEPEDISKRTVFTGAGMVLGTPQYMAPELILGEEVDGRVDQYALAITVYEMIAGKVPFPGSSAPAIFIQQTTKPPLPLRDAAPNVPPALAAAVDRALAKSPSERFATCADFVQAALGSSPPPVPKTEVEHLAYREPMLDTIQEPRRAMETPSGLRNPTQPATMPAPRPAPAKSSRGLLLGGIAALALLALGGVAAFFLVPRGEPSLTLSQIAPLSVAPGDQQPIRVELERKHLQGEVTCWLDGLPDGVKAERITVAKDQSKGIIDLTVAPSAAPAKATATLKAKCQTTEASVPVEVAIHAAAPSLRFLTISPATLKAGETATVTVNVERKNCDGPVTIAVDGLPEGVTWHRPFFNAPVIPLEQSSYPIELKAVSSVANGQVNVKVTGTLKKLSAKADFMLTVFAAPTPEPKIPDQTAKVEPKVEPKIEPKIEPKVEPKVEPKGTDIGKQPTTPDPNLVKGPPDLVLSPIIGFVLRPGERHTMWVQLERYNAVGPVAITVQGLPAGLTIEPPPPLIVPATRIALPIDVVAGPSVADGRTKFTVTATLDNLRRSTPVTIVTQAPVPEKAGDNREILWQRADRLADSDPFDRVRTQSRSKSLSVFLKANQTYTIDMASDTFDSYLRLETRAGVQLEENDNGGGGLNARITFVPRETGIHYVIATSANPGETGSFTIKIR